MRRASAHQPGSGPAQHAGPDRRPRAPAAGGFRAADRPPRSGTSARGDGHRAAPAPFVARTGTSKGAAVVASPAVPPVPSLAREEPSAARSAVVAGGSGTGTGACPRARS